MSNNKKEKKEIGGLSIMVAIAGVVLLWVVLPLKDSLESANSILGGIWGWVVTCVASIIVFVLILHIVHKVE